MKRKAERLEDPTPGDLSDAVRHAAAEWKARMDAGLNPREQAELNTWLAAAPTHRGALARFDEVWQKFDRPFNAGATDQLLDELRRRRHHRRRRMLSIAAGAVTLFAIGALWQHAGHPSLAELSGFATHPAIASSAVLHVPKREALSDGSVVELRDGARFAVEFTPAARRVRLLSGEAHFHVAKDAARPFIVTAGNVEARAVGTAFSVQVRPKTVAVLVTEGHVAVDQSSPATEAAAPHAENAGSPEPLAVLGVGNNAVFEREGPSSHAPEVTVIPPEEMERHLAWRAPRVEFTRTTLAEAVAVLNEYSATHHTTARPSVRFLIAEHQLSDVRVSGRFQIDNTEAFVSVLKNGFRIEAEKRGDDQIVLRRVAGEPQR
jgi:transmembrane sensor